MLEQIPNSEIENYTVTVDAKIYLLQYIKQSDFTTPEIKKKVEDFNTLSSQEISIFTFCTPKIVKENLEKRNFFDKIFNSKTGKLLTEEEKEEMVKYIIKLYPEIKKNSKQNNS